MLYYILCYIVLDYVILYIIKVHLVVRFNCRAGQLCVTCTKHLGAHDLGAVVAQYRTIRPRCRRGADANEVINLHLPRVAGDEGAIAWRTRSRSARTSVRQAEVRKESWSPCYMNEENEDLKAEAT